MPHKANRQRAVRKKVLGWEGTSRFAGKMRGASFEFLAPGGGSAQTCHTEDSRESETWSALFSLPHQNLL